MDPTTTLITFMLQTSPTTRTVQLVGSWDNFTTRYPMEMDTKRGSGEWRGCYSFKDIVCDGDDASSCASKRNGGLKMGETYYYYYEIDDATEVHNSRLPSTTACQYLPGQPVNLLFVPVEKATTIKRRASMGAVAHLKTMNPADKFLAPRAPPPTPRGLRNLSTSAGLSGNKRGSRSTSPARSSWSAKNLFGVRCPSPPNERPVTRGRHLGDAAISRPSFVSRSGSSMHTATIPLREFSPLSLRSSSPQSRDASPGRPRTSYGRMPPPMFSRISEAILEDDCDDNNFAVISDGEMDFESTITTYLSPPPSKHNSLELPAFSPLPAYQMEDKPLARLPELHLHRPQPKSHFSLDSISTTMSSPIDGQFDFDFSPVISECNDDANNEAFLGAITESPVQARTERPRTANPFRCYSLPFDSEEEGKMSRGKMMPVAYTMPSISGSHINSPEPFGFRQTEKSEAGMPSSNLSQLFTEMGYLGEMIEQ